MRSEHDGRRARVEAADKTAGLALVTEIEAVPGGAIRARHTLTNLGRQPYVVDSLEVVFPLPGRVGEVLDFTGRQTAERIPQRHQIGDGLWLREGRRGHTGHDSATVLVAGVPGFAFGSGEVYGLHVAWSGNTVHRVERVPSGLGMAEEAGGGTGEEYTDHASDAPGATTIGGGELLLPGEIVLAEGESYATPWVYLAAARSGLDDLSAQFHGYLRSLPAHPRSPAAGQPQRVGSGLLPPRLRQAGRAGRRRRRAGRGTVRPGRRLVRAGAAATRPASATGGSTRTSGRAGCTGWWTTCAAAACSSGSGSSPRWSTRTPDLYRAHPDWILAAGHRGRRCSGTSWFST